MGNRRFTFKGLLADKKVEIPVLQRDYVQGNLKDKKAESIREDFVADLVSHLIKSNPGEMTLDFIYGKIIDDDLSEEQERHEEHLESLLETVSEYAQKNGFEIQKSIKRLDGFVLKDTFVPFDGQQRLTTLFLLHFLVYSKLKRDISFLRNFLYKTRESSRDFLEALLNNQNDFTTDDVWQNSFADFIKDRNWFYEFWKYDPTVMSMLVMMEQFRQTILKQPNLQDSLESILKNLESTDVLTFDYLDIEEHNLNDVLYVKMNASGKELTDFEKYKSWLIEYVEEHKISLSDQEWEDKIDTSWYDLFWEVNKEKTDELIYQYFKKLLMLKYCSQEILVSDDEEREQIAKTRKLIYDRLNGKEEIPFNFYKENKIINADSLNFIYWNLNALHTVPQSFETSIQKVWNKTFISDWAEEKSFKDFVISDLGNFNLFHQTFLFSIFTYIEQLNKSSKEFSEDNFFDWIRVSRNLIYNARIDDPVAFFTAIQNINRFGDNCLNVKAVLENENFIGFFPERQRKEEFEKSKILYDQWQSDFIKAENHTYFYGQIGFLIELSEIDGLPNLDKFRYLFSSLSEIFNDENLKNSHIISRTLLTIDNTWMPKYGSDRYLFCLANRGNSRDRDENWRRVFNDEIKRRKLVELVELYQQYGSLEDIINARREYICDWRRLFIDNPNELNYCKQGLINFSKEGNYIRLLGQSRISHYHRELRTSVLFNRFLKDKFGLQNNNYEEVKSDDDCFVLLPIENFQIKVVFSFEYLNFLFYKTIENSDIELSYDELKNIDEQLYTSFMSMNSYVYHNLTTND